MCKRLKKFLKAGVLVVFCFVLGRPSNLFAQTDIAPTPIDKQLVAEALKKLPDDQTPATGNLDDSLFKLQYKGHEYFILVAKKKVESKDDYGLRFFLFKQVNDKAVFLNSTHGQMDSDILEPIFRKTDDKLFVFGLIGTEYLWGFNVYQLTEDHLKRLGLIDVAPQEENVEIENSFKLWLNAQGRPIVAFTVPLRLNPGSQDERLVSLHKDEEIQFAYDGNKFVFSKIKKQN